MNAAVDWAAALMKVMASSSEAEIGAGCHAGKRLVYVRNVWGELLSVLPKRAISHIVDNSALPHLTMNVGVSAKTEHFLRWQHILRYLVVHGWIRLHLCTTGDMLADPLTKVSFKPAYLTFRKVAMNL
jgi:hypothetical protein